MNEKHPSTFCAAAKHPKHSRLRIVKIQEKTVVLFSYHQPGHYVSTHIIFAYLGFFAKFSASLYL